MFKNFLSAFKLTWKFNDGFMVFYYIAMFLMIVSSNYFVSSNFSVFQYNLVIYLVLVLALKPKVIKRYDVSKNLLMNTILLIAFFLVFNLKSNTFDILPPFEFTGVIAKFVYLMFGLAVSESLIRRGLLEKIGSSIWTNIIMGLGHGMTYASLTNFEYGVTYFWMITGAVLGFFAFEWIGKKFSLQTESGAHMAFDWSFF